MVTLTVVVGLPPTLQHRQTIWQKQNKKRKRKGKGIPFIYVRVHLNKLKKTQLNKFQNVAEGSHRATPVQEHGCRVRRFYTERSESNATHGQYMFSEKIMQKLYSVFPILVRTHKYTTNCDLSYTFLNISFDMLSYCTLNVDQ